MDVKMVVHYGGYVGAEEEYEVKVDDDATEDEVQSACEERYEELIHENCYFEVVS